ncbi:hypothetical protein A33O_05125 [Nitratireductor aquibiodomus RA22]|uniref:Uncharacterized protein n=1 Tax=Nitratireductor aquibiodomus RA22 TaxID=1189611 RepID=I5C3X8_9HYPH|nr:hypothetical protein [Nitratireductor aquibiodomus]EIM76530.1 hypothetical protein A33O_05125 [Nitratireductor aquibiodomus RA22]
MAGAAAAGMETTRTEEQGVVHHRLESCAFERGLAVASYSFRKKLPYRPAALQLTDLCYDRKGGRLWASEPEDRLTLVQQNQDGERFEVILPDTRPFQRWRVTSGSYENAFGHDSVRAGSVPFHYDRPATKQLNWEHTGTQLDGDVSLYGYVFETQSPASDMASDFVIYVSGNDYWAHVRGREKKHRGREVPIIQFEGDLHFSGKSSGKAVLRNTTETAREGRGELQLSVGDDGEITGSGVLSLANARLAGADPDDWQTTTWEIRKLVGHLVGGDGQQFTALAIAEGQTVDHDGFVNPVHASITISGYSKKLLERWGEAVAAPRE